MIETPPSRAQSEVVGVIILTAVVVILVGGFGAVYLSASASGEEGPLVDAQVSLTDTDVVVTHGGGDTVALADLTLVLRGDGTTERYAFDRTNVTNTVTADGQFEPTERFRRAHGLSPGPVTVYVVHEPSNTVLEQDYLDVPA